MYKKIIATLLTVSLISQSIYAAGVSGLASSTGIMNITPASSGTVNGKSFYSTGSIYYRFGAGPNTYEPIYHISPPDIQASCAGINLKGMFVSMLGFDRIAKMLKSAGASFAWGIVVGLIYSLPGIFSAFKMLNAWAKKIQQLLQNSCNAGQKLGRKLGGNQLAAKTENMKSSFESFFSSNIGTSDAKQVAEAQNAQDQQQKGLLGEAIDWWASAEPFNSDDLNDVPESVVFKNVGALQMTSLYMINPSVQYAYDLQSKAIIKVGGNLADGAFEQYLNSVVYKTLITGFNIGAKQIMNTGFSMVVYGSGTPTNEKEYISVKNIVSTLYNDNVLEGVTKYILASLETSADAYSQAEFYNLDDVTDSFNTTVEAYLESTSHTKEELMRVTSNGERKHIEYNKHKATEVSIKSFGKFIGYTFMYPVTISNGVASSDVNKSVNGNGALDQIRASSSTGIIKPSIIPVTIKEGLNDTGRMIFPVGVILGQAADKFNFEDYQDIASLVGGDATKDVDVAITQYIEDILDNDFTSSEAASRTGLPILFQVFGEKVQIYKNSDAETKETLKDTLKKAGKCLYTSAILSAFDKLSSRGSEPLSLSVSELGTIEHKKISIPRQSTAEGRWDKNFKAYKLFREGLIIGMMSESVISGTSKDTEQTKTALEKYASCEALIKDVNKEFNSAQYKIQSVAQKIKDNSL